MANYTTPAGIFDNVTDYLPPILPETPLYQEVSGNLGPGLYIFLTCIGFWLFLYLCSCAYKSHKYHANDGLPRAERLQMI